MIIKLVKLTSIITVMLVVLLGATLWLGCETNNLEAFHGVLDITSGFLLLVAIWYLIAPPHLSLTKKSATSKKSDTKR